MRLFIGTLYTIENEFEETMNKGRAIFRAVTLAEAGLPSRDPCDDALGGDS